MREQYSGLVAAIASQLPPVDNVAVQTTDGTVDNVPYRVYTPANGTRPLPVGLYTHGGGLVAGSINSDDRVCRLIAEKTPCIVISVEYRLAPEHKVPAMLEDAMVVANWVCLL